MCLRLLRFCHEVGPLVFFSIWKNKIVVFSKILLVYEGVLVLMKQVSKLITFVDQTHVFK
jgi:uncharacterized membrane protein